MEKFVNRIAIVFVCILLIAYAIFFNFYGIDLADSFFNYNSYKNFEFDTASGMIFLTQFFGNLVYRFIGENLIHYRIVNSCIYLIVFLLPVFLVPKEKRSLKYFFLVLIAFVLYSPMIQNILNYDTFSYLAIIILLITLVKYYQSPSLYKLTGLSFFTAIAIGFRIPNLVLIPLLSFLIFLFHFLNKDNKRIRSPFIFIFFVSLFYLVLVTIFYGNLSSFIDSIRNGVDDSGYSLIELLNSYLKGLLQVFFYLCLLLIAFLYFKFKQNFYPERKTHFLVGILLFSIFYYFVIFNKSFGWQLSLFITSIFILIVSIFLIENLNEYNSNNKIQILIFLTLIVVMFVPAAGSNTGLTRCSIVIVFFPFLISNLSTFNKNWIITLLLLIVPFAVYDRFDKLFYDNHFFQLTERPKTSVLADIKTKPVLANTVNKIDLERNRYLNEKKEIYFYGFYSHYFLYQYNLKYSKLNFRQEITLKSLKELKAKLKDKVIFVVDIFENTNSNELLICQVFEKEKFNIFNKKTYCIIEPK